MPTYANLGQFIRLLLNKLSLHSFQQHICKGVRESSSDQPDICADPDKSDSVDSGEITWPDADWSLESIGNYDSCEYKGSADGPGILTCDNLDDIQCEGVTHSEEKCGTDYAYSIWYSTLWLQRLWGNTLGDD
ncbi:hypothetical protein MPH_04177 [Macrophomina phaseolina MS6]|uniref:Uncharacterized protein n=1 Tax=Macrophomina phaseolina (strain MS6) TaxID=1126212 RepID=K2S858_MACPH|nr:hypothetical protein MPH_04177 [Macrophomina phaseolina MS6]